MVNIETQPPTLHLTEFQTLTLPETALSGGLGELLWRTLDQTGKKLLVTFPSPKTDGEWQLTAQGWVGQIHMPHQLTLRILPKVPMARIFKLWEMAYDLQLAELGDGVTAVSAIPDFFSLLAQILAQWVIRRGRQGFQKAYLQQTAALPYVRGKLLPPRTAAASPTVQLTCRFDAHTADIPDNQIVAYTLHQLARSGQCNPMAQTAVRQAYHLLQPLVTMRPFQPSDCQNRSYGRLNQDYATLHALCRFFLEHTGPRLATGEHQLMPFLLNMAQLYERSIANWLQANLQRPYQIKAQESTTIGANDELRFQIDLTLYGENGRPLAVLDTKYKTPDKPSQADISQVITYAKAKRCHHACLIYPQPLPQPLHVTVGDVQLHTLTFGLDESLDGAGQQFVQQLKTRLNL
ncbi:McrC family protein [Candidatus Leptofilum sp.]|uniref:McrC family protein n=1 Tax=Candidatus Leptofilum sp. TaxID=3241576 RepID=UPI003B58C08A